MVEPKRCAVVLWICAGLAGCGSDSADKESKGTDSDTAGDTDLDAGDTGDPSLAINEDFENWAEGDERFMLAKGDPGSHDDNGARAVIDGESCLTIHADAVDNDGYGFSVEAELALDRRTDMSGEDYVISFDVYIPKETYSKGANVQFALYDTTDYTPIYSKWWVSSLKADEWVTVRGEISTTSGDIDYSGFASNPSDWVFDAVRVQLIINGARAAEGDEVLFYIDDMRIEQTEPAGGDTDTGSTDTDTDTAEPEGVYEVTVDGEAVPVERVSKFAVPVSYVHLDHTGEEMAVRVAAAEPIDAYTLSPKSRDVASAVDDDGVLSFSLTEPGYFILQIPEKERLFILVDPRDADAPAPGDADVRNIMDYDGVDNTGGTVITEVLQAAIDEASGSDKSIVYIPEGTYASETLYLKDDMTLYLARGAVLQNATPQADLISQNPDLVQIETCTHGFIVMNGVSNARLMGRGTIDGNGVTLQAANRKMFLVKIENSDNCTVEGVISRDSCFWNTMIYRSDQITVQNYKVINNRLDGEWNETDGVDFNNSTQSVLTNAFLYTGDDCMAVKSDDIQDDLELGGIIDPTSGDYINVADIAHEQVVCYSGSSACKVGTKTFGETMSNISFTDIDVVMADRALVIDAVDTAEITGTRFADIRIENVTGRLIDFNMDPEAIEWRTNLGISTVTETEVINVASDVSAECRIHGNVHDWNEEEPYYGNEYFIDGVTFSNFTVDGAAVTSLEDESVSFNVNDYARNITFSDAP